jgi:hypothetical protein
MLAMMVAMPVRWSSTHTVTSSIYFPFGAGDPLLYLSRRLGDIDDALCLGSHRDLFLVSLGVN